MDEPWNRVFEAPKRVYPTPNGSLRERARPSARVQELVEPPQPQNGSLRERTPPGMRVQAIAEPSQTPNGSLRERMPPGMRVQVIAEPRQNGSLREHSPPGARVQEMAEPPQPMDELRQLAAELTRRLGLIGQGSGLTDGRYPVQNVEQGMPPAV